MRVKVHPHVPRMKKRIPECLSVSEANGNLLSYQRTILLHNVTFRVQPAGLRRYRETGVRNVHAWMVGDLAKVNVNTLDAPVRVRYADGKFLTEDNIDVTGWKFRSAYAEGPKFYVEG